MIYKKIISKTAFAIGCITRKYTQNMDRFIFSTCCFIAFCGFIAILTVSNAIGARIGVSPVAIIIKQVIFLSLSFGLMVFVSNLEKEYLFFYSNLIAIMFIIALILVLFIGIDIKGSSRWIGLKAISIQPSEILKPFFIILNAKILAKIKSEKDKTPLVKSIILTGLIAGLLILEPDFGMMTIFCLTSVFQIFISGVRLRVIFSLGALFAIVMAIAFLTVPHVKNRIMGLVSSSEVGYQTQKAQESIKSGGFFGKGLGNGSVKYNLPDSHTDFIFSTICEELGHFFAILLILAYSSITIRSLILIPRITGEKTSILTVYGCAFMFFAQTFINIGVNLHILPNKGMTLPFVSFGGSALLGMGILIGVIMCLTKKNNQIRNQYRKLYSPFWYD